MSIVLNSTGGGSVTINEPTTASNFTQTLPASTGTVMVSGNMPAFSAYMTTGQTLTAATYTKLAFNATTFDTASAFNTSTYRFTAPVAGIYQVNTRGGLASTTGSFYPTIYKNGAVYMYGVPSVNVSSVDNASSFGTLISLTINDYVEIYAYTNSTQTSTSASNATDFSMVMVRAT
jgi:hypothetical protein